MEKVKRNVLLNVPDMTIGHGKSVLYRNVSFDVCEGDCIMLCGANGSGKTTLLKALSLMQTLNGAQIVMIPSRIPKVKGFTLREFIRLSCFRQSDMGGRLAGDDELSISSALTMSGLDGLAERDISTLSDGEFQKGGIAAALVQHAGIILLDEPTAFLDAENRISVLRTLQELSTRSLARETASGRPAVIFSTHDLHDGLAVCSKVLALGADGIFRCASYEDRESMKAAVESIFSSCDYLKK